MQSRVCFTLCILCASVVAVAYDENYLGNYENGYEYTPLPFPPCYAIDVDCQRRGLRTFFFLMDSQRLGMKAVDPSLLTSVSVSCPEQQVDFRLRKVNVTGARWSKLVNRKFKLPGGKSSVIFISDLHVTADILMNMADRLDSYWSQIILDIHGVESNITYPWYGQRGIDLEDYILIGHERITTRNSRTPTYFLYPVSDDAHMIDEVLQSRPATLDYLSDEITTSVMHAIVDNFRLFARNVPVKYYYKYTS